MLNVRALYAFLMSLFFTPALALAQVTGPAEQPTAPYEATRWGAGWLWLLVLAIAIVALVSWSMSRGRSRRGPPVAR